MYEREGRSVAAPGDLRELVAGALAEWRRLRIDDFDYQHWNEAHLLLVALASVALCLTIARLAFRGDRAAGVVLPALLGVVPRSRAAVLRHAPVLVFLAGLPFFACALADPYSSLVLFGLS
jgi:hypothetical protein